ncbi:carbonic anhydrase [Candidatus Pelagibacter sp. RS39]|uniref:carbonic anhydrase n=1 Tax=Candidatus Pelagibacter sp. RS39 TaxID=1977864 RepID=UPI001E62311B|nr:carbonic anhydrase [Candidatus Pelagibacter sp. RS39]|tara:strand:+ start:111 stop:506 length:396 start_codon:yes stop_codon:yes gene_type:complete
MKKYEAMVLSCMDPRFQPKVYKYLKGKKLTGKYSSFTIAGAGIGVTHKKFKKWHSTFIDNLSTSIKLHKINKLIVINHKDCGAAKIVNGKKKFTSIIENKIHKDSFKVIKKTLNKKFPNLKIYFKILSLKD